MGLCSSPSFAASRAFLRSAPFWYAFAPVSRWALAWAARVEYERTRPEPPSYPTAFRFCYRSIIATRLLRLGVLRTVCTKHSICRLPGALAALMRSRKRVGFPVERAVARVGVRVGVRVGFSMELSRPPSGVAGPALRSARAVHRTRCHRPIGGTGGEASFHSLIGRPTASLWRQLTGGRYKRLC